MSPSSLFSEIAEGVQLCPQEDLTCVDSTQLGLGDIKSDQKVSAVTEITNGTEKGTPVRRNPGRAVCKSEACVESLIGKKSPWQEHFATQDSTKVKFIGGLKDMSKSMQGG
jgi:hypothetical protein